MYVIVYRKGTQSPTLALCATNILRYGIKGDEIICAESSNAQQK
jgi:hypothetical protein